MALHLLHSPTVYLYCPMKKPLKKASYNYSLGDLIVAVSSYSRNNRETVAAVADLLESGQVRLSSQGRMIRARVC